MRRDALPNCRCGSLCAGLQPHACSCGRSQPEAVLPAAAVLYSVLRNWSRQKKHTWDDYHIQLREFDWEEARAVFDHEKEDRLKALKDRYRTGGPCLSR